MKTIREKIEVMQAFERGEKIQCLFQGNKEWTDVAPSGPSWNWHLYDYRVVKKPREFWVNDYGTHVGSLFPSKEEAERAGKSAEIGQYRGTLHLVEKL